MYECGQCTFTAESMGAVIDHRMRAHDRDDGGAASNTNEDAEQGEIVASSSGIVDEPAPSEFRAIAIDELFCGSGIQVQAEEESEMGMMETEVPAQSSASFFCDMCGESFASSTELTNHRQAVHVSDAPAEVLFGVVAPTPPPFALSLAAPPTQTRHKCRLCEQVFKTKGDMYQHMKRHDQSYGPHLCPKCPVPFYATTRGGLAQHVRQQHSTSQPPPMAFSNPKFDKQCQICQEMVPLAYMPKHMSHHMRSAGAFKCDECPFDVFYSTADGLTAHKRRKHGEPIEQFVQKSGGGFPCQYPGCVIECIDREKLYKHARFHDHTLGNGQFKCAEVGCVDMFFPNAQSIAIHRTKRHTAMRQPTPVYLDTVAMPSPLKPLRRNYACIYPTCGKVFDNSVQLAKHASYHDERLGFGQFKCEELDCVDMYFPSGVSLGVHRARRHTTVVTRPVYPSPLPAPEARIIATSRATDVHRPTRDYVCAICSATFTKHGSYAIHLSWHKRRAKTSKHQCHHCPRSFLSFTMYQAHMIAHRVGAKSKPTANMRVKYEIGVPSASASTGYKCSLCAQTFHSYASLAVHVGHHRRAEKSSTSSSGHRFVCGTCGKRFEREHSLVSHEGWHRRTTGALAVLAPSTARTKTCEVCKRECTESNYYLHIRRHDPNNGTSQCPICPQLYFASEAGVNVHLGHQVCVDEHGQPIADNGSKKTAVAPPPSGHLARQQRHVVGSFACSHAQCGKRFVTFASMQTHESWHKRWANGQGATREQEGIVARESTKLCDICKRKVPDGEFEEHCKEHDPSTGDFKCTHCPQLHFATSYELMDHSRANNCFDHSGAPIVDNGYRPTEGDAKWQPTLRCHPDAQGKYPCSKCGQKFDDYRAWNSHDVWHKRSTGGDGKVKCEICSVWMAKERLAAHEQRHNPDNGAHKCDNCPEVYFTTEAGLMKHLMLNQCIDVEGQPITDNGYIPVGVAQSVNRARGPSSRGSIAYPRRMCTICNRGIHPWYFDKHMARHDPSTGSFLCGTCPQMHFATETSLKIHLGKKMCVGMPSAKNYATMTKAHRCDQCGSCQTDLVNHQRRHDRSTGDFECATCRPPLYFHTAKAQTAHMGKRNCWQNGTRVVIDPPADQATTSHSSLSGESKLCSHPGCGKSFDTQWYLTKHRLCHDPSLGGGQFKCDDAYCADIYFTHDHALRLHKVKEHGMEAETVEVDVAVPTEPARSANGGFACTYRGCTESSFPAYKTAVEHAIRHDSSIAGGQHRCSVCVDLYFPTAMSVSQHFRVHKFVPGKGGYGMQLAAKQGQMIQALFGGIIPISALRDNSPTVSTKSTFMPRRSVSGMMRDPTPSTTSAPGCVCQKCGEMMTDATALSLHIKAAHGGEMAGTSEIQIPPILASVVIDDEFYPDSSNVEELTPFIRPCVVSIAPTDVVDLTADSPVASPVFGINRALRPSTPSFDTRPSSTPAFQIVASSALSFTSMKQEMSSPTKMTSEMTQQPAVVALAEEEEEPMEIGGRAEIEEITYVCPTCHRQFDNQTAYDMHAKSHTAIQQPTQGQLPQGPQQLLYWPQGQQQQQLRVQQPPNSVNCSVCQKSVTRYFLSQHMRVHDPSNGPFLCPNCPRSYFGSNHGLNVHLSKNNCAPRSAQSAPHQAPTPPVSIASRCACPICGVGFTYPALLNAHMSFHDPSTGPHMCPVCPQTYFSTRQGRAKHVTSRHPTYRSSAELIVNKNSCTICAMVVPRQDTERHNERHDPATGSFPCTGGCPQTWFRTEGLANMHMTRAHKRLERVTVAPQGIVAPRVTVAHPFNIDFGEPTTSTAPIEIEELFGEYVDEGDHVNIVPSAVQNHSIPRATVTQHRPVLTVTHDQPMTIAHNNWTPPSSSQSGSSSIPPAISTLTATPPPPVGALFCAYGCSRRACFTNEHSRRVHCVYMHGVEMQVLAVPWDTIQMVEQGFEAVCERKTTLKSALMKLTAGKWAMAEVVFRAELVPMLMVETANRDTRVIRCLTSVIAACRAIHARGTLTDVETSLHAHLFAMLCLRDLPVAFVAKTRNTIAFAFEHNFDSIAYQLAFLLLHKLRGTLSTEDTQYSMGIIAMLEMRYSNPKRAAPRIYEANSLTNILAIRSADIFCVRTCQPIAFDHPTTVCPSCESTYDRAGLPHGMLCVICGLSNL